MVRSPKNLVRPLLPASDGFIETGRARRRRMGEVVTMPLMRDRRPGGEAWLATLDVGLAADTHTLDEAFRLVHDQYAWRGYIDPVPSGRRVTVYHALPSTRIFAALSGGKVVGTLTLLQDSVLPLPMEELYAAELDALRQDGRQVGEVSALATDRACRRAGLEVVVRLMRALVIYAAELARLDDLCIAVNPRHVDFYQRYLRFQRLGALRAYRKVKGAPAVALRLDLDFVRRLTRAVQAGRVAGNPVYDFFFGQEHHQRTVRRLREEVARTGLTPQQFGYFFGDGHALADATPAARQVIASLYAGFDVTRPGAPVHAGACPGPAPGAALLRAHAARR
jgi:ribosomal protein S18 acetylase RimI-like enzyme